MFYLFDELHDEPFGEFASFSDAVAEVRRLASLPWDQEPNLAPCTAWRTCGREYEIREGIAFDLPGPLQRGTRVASISATGVVWAAGHSAADRL
jgi:hypothetical protein